MYNYFCFRLLFKQLSKSFSIFIFLLISVYFLGINNLYAWSPQIHSLVCENVWSLLNQQQRSWVLEAYQGHKIKTLRTGCLWPDWVRGEDRYKETRKWHYQDYHDSPHVSTDALHQHCSEGCLLAAARDQVLILRGEKVGNRGDALFFLLHILTDLHQPLHTGRIQDRGGNSLDIWFQGKKSNLHKLWDGRIFPKNPYIIDAILKQKLASEDFQETLIWPDSLLVWLGESRTIVSQQIYPDYQKSKGQIDIDYLEKFRPIGYQQLYKAINRLYLVIQNLSREVGDGSQ